uniref:Uncharacterized protein n=1 Tax=Arundo donax TaxID=35708 RepID=A0A0A9B516_ARUDO
MNSYTSSRSRLLRDVQPYRVTRFWWSMRDKMSTSFRNCSTRL